MIAWTSRLALRATLEGLAGLQREVYEAIARWPEEGPGPSLQELAVQVGRKEGSVCGRLAELRAVGAIADGPLKVGGCGKLVKTYRAWGWREAVWGRRVEADGQVALL